MKTFEELYEDDDLRGNIEMNNGVWSLFVIAVAVAAFRSTEGRAGDAWGGWR
jgi:hypothetical protein